MNKPEVISDEKPATATPTPDRERTPAPWPSLMPRFPLNSEDVRVSVPAEGFDRWLHAFLGKTTMPVSPSSLLLAYTDWLSHLALSPAKQVELTQKWLRKAYRMSLYMPHAMKADTPPCIEPLEQDRRFSKPDWQQWPFNVYYQSFLLLQQWWYNATTEVRGVSKHHEEVVTFVTRQLLDMCSPSNFIGTNPEVLRKTVEKSGANLVAGWFNWLDDWERRQAGKSPAGTEAYVVGQNVAITPGRVVFRNRLIELIQYEPTTPKVYAEPVLIVPAWILKYYILDLSPHNSMVKYLVDHGHTVFCISWKNPTSQDRDRGMEDYLNMGLMDALDAVTTIVPDQKVHSVGYCAGGILLSIGAAAMVRDNDDRLKSVTLFTTQVDFTEPGEIGLFIDEGQVSFLEDLMFDRGYLGGSQLSGTFQLLRSNDLIWSRLVHEYLMGERAPMKDLMAWNADTCRVPYRAHAELIRRLFLQNDLAEGRYRVQGKPIALNDIRVPIFSVGAITDHVAPWRSAYKIHLLTDTEVTFVLTAGGHNVGIVNEPGKAHRSYQVLTRLYDGKYIDPDAYLARAERREGSWWPEWQAWLAARSASQVAPPQMGALDKGYARLMDAPGSYVMMR